MSVISLHIFGVRSGIHTLLRVDPEIRTACLQDTRLREEQMDRMAGIERRENESQKSVQKESTDRKIDLIEDTSDEEIVNECDDDFVSGSETEPIETTHRVLSRKIPVQIPQTSNTKSGMKPLTPKSVNRKHRSHTKKISVD